MQTQSTVHKFSQIENQLSNSKSQLQNLQKQLSNSTLQKQLSNFTSNSKVQIDNQNSIQYDNQDDCDCEAQYRYTNVPVQTQQVYIPAPAPVQTQQVYIPAPVQEVQQRQVVHRIIQPLQLSSLQNIQIQPEPVVQKTDNSDKYEKEIKKLLKTQEKLQQQLEETKQRKEKTEYYPPHVYQKVEPIDTQSLKTELAKLESLMIEKQSRVTQDKRIVEVKFDDQGSGLKKTLKRLHKLEIELNEERGKRQEFEYKFKALKSNLGDKEEVTENISLQIKKLQKQKTDAQVELERYKVLAQFLEEENERLRNMKPEVIKEIIHNTVKPEPIQVERERIVEVPVERIVEVPFERIVTVEKRVEIPVEVIKEVFVPYDKIVEVPVEVERRVEVPYERIVEVEKIVEVPIYIDQYLEEREFLKRDVQELKNYAEDWRLKYISSQQELEVFIRDNNEYRREQSDIFNQLNDQKRKNEQLYQDIQQITLSNHRKNEDIENHIRHLEASLHRNSLNNFQQPQQNRQYY